MDFKLDFLFLSQERRQLFTAIEEYDETEECKENVCPITNVRATGSTNQQTATTLTPPTELSSNHIPENESFSVGQQVS